MLQRQFYQIWCFYELNTGSLRFHIVCQYMSDYSENFVGED
jgi:hypothetical protein